MTDRQVFETFAQQQEDVRRDLTHQHRRKIPALTGIRGIAAMWVVLFHADELSHSLKVSITQDLLPVIRSGYLGVDLFFLLSGFVLMLTYGEAVSARRTGIRDFAIGRMFRILPLHWTILLMFVAASRFGDAQWTVGQEHDAASILVAAFLLQTAVHQGQVWNSPAWSLSAEWICYFLFPAAAYLTAKVRSGMGLIVGAALPLVFLAVLMSIRFHPPTLATTERLGICRCAAEMVAGMAAYRLCSLRPPSGKSGDRMVIAGLLLLATAMLGSYAEFVALPAFMLLIVACYGSSPIAAVLFGNRPVHRLGEISFSLYLMHWLLFRIAIDVAQALGGSEVALCAAVLLPPILVVPLAWATWRWIEVPGQAAGRAVVARLRARDAARQAPAISAAT